MNAQEYYKRGVEHYNNARYSAALNDFNHCIKLRSSSNPNAGDYYYRAATYSFLGKQQEALGDINQCITLRQGSPGAWDYYWQGKINYELKNYQVALKSLTQCIMLRNESPQAWDYYFRAASHSFLENHPAALEDINQCIRLRKESSTAWDYYWQGVSYYHLGRYSEALNSINQCLSLRKGSPTAWDYYYRAAIYFYLDNYPAALEDINLCIRLRKESLTAWDYYWHGRINYKLKNYSPALESFNQCITLRNNSLEPSDYYWRGKVYQALHQATRAQEDFKHLLQLPVTKDYHYYYQSRLYFAAKQYPAALQALQKAITQLKTAPFDRYYYGRAKIHYELGTDKEVVRDCQKALSFKNKQKYKTLLEQAVQRQHKQQEQKNSLAPPPAPSSLLKPPSAIADLSTALNTLQISFAIPYGQLTFSTKLGEGGFGVVYKGTYRFNNVAIKQLKTDKLSTSVEEEFKQEMTIMAQLRSPNIVLLYGAVTDKTPYCLVMEYMEKGSLFSVLHSTENLSWSVRENIALDVIKGLAYLHHEKIIHRDLKSMNVLLDAQYKAKLTDFGLAKTKAETASTSTNKLVGTLAWMAPELFGRRAIYTEKSDIYSYAMLLWELSSRKLPFSDASNQQLIAKWVSEGEREDIPENTPPQFAKLITWGWKAKSEERPTAAEATEFLQTKKEVSSDPLPTYQDNLSSGILSGPQYLSNTVSQGPS